MSLTKEHFDEVKRTNAMKPRDRAATEESTPGRSVLIDVKPGSEPASPLQWIMIAIRNDIAAQAVPKVRKSIDSPSQHNEIKRDHFKLGSFGRMASETLQSSVPAVI
jgi:hypothetical protein